MRKLAILISLRDEIEREFEQGIAGPDIIERLKDERDKARAECQDLLSRIKNLSFDKDLVEQVAQMKADLFGLNIVKIFRDKHRMVEYDPTSADLCKEHVNEELDLLDRE